MRERRREEAWVKHRDGGKGGTLREGAWSSTNGGRRGEGDEGVRDRLKE